MKFDKIDEKLLEVLKEDGRATVREIARKINAPITTVHNRLRKMTREGSIRKFTIIPDYEKLGKGVLALVSLSVDHGKMGEGKTAIDAFKKALRMLPEVEKSLALTGDIDWMIFVRVKDIKELDDFLVRKLRSIRGIQRTITQIVLEED